MEIFAHFFTISNNHLCIRKNTPFFFRQIFRVIWIIILPGEKIAIFSNKTFAYKNLQISSISVVRPANIEINSL